MSDYPLLSLAIWIPIIGGLVVMATGSDRNAPLARLLALVGSVVGFLVTIPLYTGFDAGSSAMQFVELTSTTNNCEMKHLDQRRAQKGMSKKKKNAH